MLETKMLRTLPPINRAGVSTSNQQLCWTTFNALETGVCRFGSLESTLFCESHVMEPKSEEESRRVDISYPNFATSSSLGVEILHALPIRCPDSPPENQELIEIPLSPENIRMMDAIPPSSSQDPEYERSRSRDQLRDFCRAGTQQSLESEALLPSDEPPADMDKPLMTTYSSLRACSQSQQH